MHFSKISKMKMYEIAKASSLIVLGLKLLDSIKDPLELKSILDSAEKDRAVYDKYADWYCNEYK